MHACLPFSDASSSQSVDVKHAQSFGDDIYKILQWCELWTGCKAFEHLECLVTMRLNVLGEDVLSFV